MQYFCRPINANGARGRELTMTGRLFGQPLPGVNLVAAAETGSWWMSK